MKFICLSDVHLVAKNPKYRKDDLFSAQFGKLKFVFDYAKTHECAILQAGDLFDAPRSFPVLSEFIKLKGQYPEVRIFSVYGQHDMKYRRKEHTNSHIAGMVGYIKYLDDKTLSVGNVDISGCSWDSDFYKKCGGYDILLIHAPIAEKATYPGHNYWDATDFLERNKYNLIVCGDIHNKQFCINIGKRKIVNSGPMCRISKDLADHKPGFFVWDSDSSEIEWVEIPHESGSMVIDTEMPIFDNKNIFDNFVEAFKGIEFNGIDIDENLKAALHGIDPGIIKIVDDIVLKCKNNCS